jgi:hypothetical protein
MTKLQNRCSNCGGKFGLVSHHHWGLRFCRKACKDNFLAKTAKDYACMRRWFGFLPRGAAAGSFSIWRKQENLSRREPMEPAGHVRL